MAEERNERVDDVSKLGAPRPFTGQASGVGRVEGDVLFKVAENISPGLKGLTKKGEMTNELRERSWETPRERFSSSSGDKLKDADRRERVGVDKVEGATDGLRTKADGMHRGGNIVNGDEVEGASAFTRERKRYLDRKGDHRLEEDIRAGHFVDLPRLAVSNDGRRSKDTERDSTFERLDTDLSFMSSGLCGVSENRSWIKRLLHNDARSFAGDKSRGEVVVAIEPLDVSDALKDVPSPGHVDIIEELPLCDRIADKGGVVDVRDLFCDVKKLATS